MPLFAVPQIHREDRADGAVLLSSRDPLRAYPRSLGAWLRAGAEAHPDRELITRRTESLTYAAALEGADALAQAFLDRGLGPDRPVVVLSGNSIEHALITALPA